jgi:hypothetical protein
MPAQRIAGGRLAISRFDVLGFDSSGQATFIGHVGLATAASTFPRAAGIRIADMMPPLLVGHPLPAASPVTCHGQAQLLEFEVQAIAGFVRAIQSEYQAEESRQKQARRWDKAQFRRAQYTIRPPVQWPNRQRRYSRFSCAGFVHEAYAAAGIVVVLTDEVRIPSYSLASLVRAYEHASEQLADAAFRTGMGLAGDGPWPVLLPGHVLNGLNRSRSDIDLV